MKTYHYQKNPSGQYFPIIDIYLLYKTHSARIYTLIDSGASISVFRKEVAEQLGLNIESGKIIYMGGVGGHIKGYLHNLKAEIAGKKFNLPIVFSHEYLVSFNLLGRDSFFDIFKITFEEKKKLVRLE